MEHIKYLRKINQRLKQENMRLKLAQKQSKSFYYSLMYIYINYSKVSGSILNQVTTMA